MNDILDFLYTHLTAENLMVIAFLILLEGILSFDNAIGLAALVKKKLKDKKQQARALKYGIMGAYFFRGMVLFFGLSIIKYPIIQSLAALYLLWVGVVELIPNKKDIKSGTDQYLGKGVGGILSRFLTPFWSVVVSVELMDLAFSFDSVLVAFAITDVYWLLVAGVFIGIVMMRFAAVIFIKLIDIYPILEKSAFVLIIIAALSMFAKIAGFHIEETPLVITLSSVLLSSVLINHLFPKRTEKFLKKYYVSHAHDDIPI